jgi:hypothetical protein
MTFSVPGIPCPTTYQFSIVMPVYSQNVLTRRYKNPHAYARLRDAYGMAIMVGTRLIPRAKGKRRLTLVRLMGFRGKRYDEANLMGGSKPLVDSLVRAGLLIDDSPKWLEWGGASQEKCNVEGARIILQEVE